MAGVSATFLATGSSHMCAIVTGGLVKCWGENFYGQLGIGNTVDQPGIVVDANLGPGVTRKSEREGGKKKGGREGAFMFLSLSESPLPWSRS